METLTERNPAAMVTARRCARCQCTDDHACAGGCSWVCASLDLCSECVRPEEHGHLSELRSLESILGIVAEMLEGKAAAAQVVLRGEGMAVLPRRPGKTTTPGRSIVTIPLTEAEAESIRFTLAGGAFEKDEDRVRVVLVRLFNTWKEGQ